MHPTFVDKPTYRFFKTSLKGFRGGFSQIDFLFESKRQICDRVLTLPENVETFISG